MTTDTPDLAKKSPYSIRMVNGEPFFFIPITHKSDLDIPPYDPTVDYTKLCEEMVRKNAEASQQLQTLILEYKNLASKLEKYQNAGGIEAAASGTQKRKRHRRAAKEIERHFVCEECGKSYGSEGSLNQHVKIKHPEERR